MIANKILCHCRLNYRLFRSALVVHPNIAQEKSLCVSKRLHILHNDRDPLIGGGQNLSLQNVRHKYSNRKTTRNQDQDDDVDSDEDIDENIIEDIDKNTKIIKCSVNSLRADLVLKSGLGLARNKVETMFYESKIRVNGKKLLKKSINLRVGDEIDVVKGKSTLNPDDIVVARIEILAEVPKNEATYVTLKRFKSLQIQNYDKDPVSL